MSEQVIQMPGVVGGDALDHARSATQELHKAISSMLAKRASVTKTEVDGVIKKANSWPGWP